MKKKVGKVKCWKSGIFWQIDFGGILINHDRKVKTWFVEIDDSGKRWVHFVYYKKDGLGRDCMKVDMDWMLSQQRTIFCR